MGYNIYDNENVGHVVAQRLILLKKCFTDDIDSDFKPTESQWNDYHAICTVRSFSSKVYSLFNCILISAFCPWLTIENSKYTDKLNISNIDKYLDSITFSFNRFVHEEFAENFNHNNTFDELSRKVVWSYTFQNKIDELISMETDSMSFLPCEKVTGDDFPVEMVKLMEDIINQCNIYYAHTIDEINSTSPLFHVSAVINLQRREYVIKFIGSYFFHLIGKKTSLLSFPSECNVSPEKKMI